MDLLRKSLIDDLVFSLIESEIITNNGNIFKFSCLHSGDSNEGWILIDGIRKGSFKVFFNSELLLTLTSNDDYKFCFQNQQASHSVGIQGKNSIEIIDSIKAVSIL